jgi:hypothetical protein
VTKRLSCTMAVLVVMLAATTLAVGSAGSTAAVPLPGARDCGDFAGPVWRIFGAGAKRGITGRHYTVRANIPCKTARALALRMTRTRSKGPGFDTTLLPGWTCLVIAPAGERLVIGGCTRGSRPALPQPGQPPPTVRGFNWHHCLNIPVGSHPTCTWKHIYR